MSHTQVTTTQTKKRKLSTQDAAPTKKLKKDAAKYSSSVSKDKGKARANDGEFNVVQASLVISIPPVFANTPRLGAEEMLDSMLMRYIPAFEGVVLAHSNLQFLDTAATILGDCPFSVCKIGFEGTVWRPRVGMTLTGKINLSSPDHISLLVHKTFNVSIPRHHIPTDQYTFEYGPAENDPEFAPEVIEAEEREDAVEEKTEDTEGGGRWVHQLTSEKLGGEAGFLTFTVVGLTVANEMLSLLGSVQVDPFSSRHIPQGGSTKQTAVRGLQAEDDEEEERDSDDENEEDDEDAFHTLGKKAKDAVAAEAKAKEAEDAAAKKEKKRKRKEEKEGKPKVPEKAKRTKKE